MPRRYKSPLRQEQAQQTRLSIIEAALAMFLENGYSQTSIREIASAAGVAERTVYVTFQDKPSILTAIADHAFYGGSQDGEGEAEFIRAMETITEPRERLRLCIRQASAGFEQGMAALGRMVAGAAISDTRLEKFAAEMVDRRHTGTRAFMSMILGSALPDEPQYERMVDELEAITSEELYWILAVERGWPSDTYEQYVADMVTATLSRYGLDLI